MAHEREVTYPSQIGQKERISAGEHLLKSGERLRKHQAHTRRLHAAMFDGQGNQSQCPLHDQARKPSQREVGSK